MRPYPQHRNYHGESKTPLYYVWCAMKTRCYIEGQKYTASYLGKGIKFHPDWKLYVPFRDWALKNGYKPGLTIDRIDNDGDYSPENCRWVASRTNNRNRASTVLNLASAAIIYDLAHRGYLPFSKIAALFGVHHNTVYEIKRGKNWPDAAAYLRGELA